MVDWNKDIEIKIWKVGESFLKKTKGWVNAKGEEILYFGTRRIEYKAEDGKDHFCFAKRDGSIYGGTEECGKVRNKRTVDDNQPTMKINQKVNKPDNRAVFYFERKGDTYTLTGWKNVMSADDINQKYGKDVYKAYIWDNTQPSFSQQRYDSLPDDVLVNVNKSKDYLLESGDVFSKDEYELIVDACKKAGERLSKLVRDSKKPEKIEVVI